MLASRPRARPPAAARAASARAAAAASASSAQPPPSASASTQRRLTLLLLRHGESEDASAAAGVPDHQRALTPGGEAAAAALAPLFAERGLLPGLVLCSDTLRSRQTVAALARSLPGLADAPVRFLGSLYVAAATDGQTAAHLMEQVRLSVSGLVSSGVRVVLCVGHNRGWEEAASELAGGASVTLRTANAAVLDCAAPSWQEATETGFSGWTLRGVLAP